MKCLYFLLVLAASQAVPLAENARGTKDIPVPTLTHITLVDPPGFKLEWTTVQSLDSSDPVLGYKVKVWEQTKVKQYHYQVIDGVKVLVEEEVPEKFSNDKIPDSTPKEIVVPGADKNSILVDPIKVGVTYEARVLAYAKSGDGPLSLPMRIQILPNDDDHKKDVYTVQ